MIGRAMILATRAWQLGPSRLLPPSCRYSPSCSAYAIDAIDRHGALRGGWLALRRVLRCHPWGGCGHDPVPAGVISERAGTGPLPRPTIRSSVTMSGGRAGERAGAATGARSSARSRMESKDLVR